MDDTKRRRSNRTEFEGLDDKQRIRRLSRTVCEELDGSRREGHGAQQAVRD